MMVIYSDIVLSICWDCVKEGMKSLELS